jgi:DNA-binding GntR family transcriptional regulator
MSAENARPAHLQLRHKVAERIRADILEGRLKPGEWLRQERLAHDYHTSQMPVREALKQLIAEGFVEHIPYRGVRVYEFAPKDIVDLYTCRAHIEGIAARHAAENVTAEQLDELTGLHQRMLACHGDTSLNEYRVLNRRFHEVIYNASQRPFLVRLLALLWVSSPSMLWGSFGPTAVHASPEREAADNAEHAAILATLCAHDGDAAEETMRHHIEESGRQLLAAL